MRKAIYPGTFDPVTNGHLDILNRSTQLFDEVIMAVANSDQKNPLFSIEERLDMINENVKNLKKITVVSFSGLLVDFAKEVNASAIIRGLRAISDFEYEFQMTQMNRLLSPEIETIFLMPNEKYFFTSSKLIKQVFRYSNKTTPLIPENVAEALKNKRSE